MSSNKKSAVLTLSRLRIILIYSRLSDIRDIYKQVSVEVENRKFFLYTTSGKQLIQAEMDTWGEKRRKEEDEQRNTETARGLPYEEMK